MKKYFYSNGTEKQGPFTFEELKNEEINPGTLIWFEGLNDWTAAKYILEIEEIFQLLPPNIPITEIEENSLNEELIEETLDSEISSNDSDDIKPKKREMFTNVFSFDGRIRRLEYGLSVIIYFFYYFFATLIATSLDLLDFLILFLIPGLWYFWAQGAKRCHDRGNSGWYQIIPFYGLWMIFAEGDNGFNNYGPNPKQ